MYYLGKIMNSAVSHSTTIFVSVQSWALPGVAPVLWPKTHACERLGYTLTGGN